MFQHLKYLIPVGIALSVWASSALSYQGVSSKVSSQDMATLKDCPIPTARRPYDSMTPLAASQTDKSRYVYVVFKESYPDGQSFDIPGVYRLAGRCILVYLDPGGQNIPLSKYVPRNAALDLYRQLISQSVSQSGGFKEYKSFVESTPMRLNVDQEAVLKEMGISPISN